VLLRFASHSPSKRRLCLKASGRPLEVFSDTYSVEFRDGILYYLAADSSKKNQPVKIAPSAQQQHEYMAAFRRWAEIHKSAQKTTSLSHGDHLSQTLSS